MENDQEGRGHGASPQCVGLQRKAFDVSLRLIPFKDVGQGAWWRWHCPCPPTLSTSDDSKYSLLLLEMLSEQSLCAWKNLALAWKGR